MCELYPPKEGMQVLSSGAESGESALPVGLGEGWYWHNFLVSNISPPQFLWFWRQNGRIPKLPFHCAYGPWPEFEIRNANGRGT